jgi:nucleoside 2-deoxyribosyltransferase
MKRIYPSSRFPKAKMWLELKDKYPVHFYARWIRNYELNTEETPENSKYFWQENIEDIRDCDLVLVYGEKTDVLGGALVEVGAALAFGKSIILTGQNEAYRSWIHHPLVEYVSSLDTALERIVLSEEYE